ncbi:MAG: hypothetical protein ACFFFK_04815 [Candidatus Thorarchaeota archaeon]
MAFFNEMDAGEDVIAYDEVGLLHVNGGTTKGKLILTQLRLVFVTGGEPSNPKLKTEHAINIKSMERAQFINSETLGVILSVDFNTSVGSHVVRYICRLDSAEKFVYQINKLVDIKALDDLLTRK